MQKGLRFLDGEKKEKRYTYPHDSNYWVSSCIIGTDGHNWWSHVFNREIQMSKIEGLATLEWIDMELAFLEDILHGEPGNKITKIRGVLATETKRVERLEENVKTLKEIVCTALSAGRKSNEPNKC